MGQVGLTLVRSHDKSLAGLASSHKHAAHPTMHQDSMVADLLCNVKVGATSYMCKLRATCLLPSSTGLQHVCSNVPQANCAANSLAQLLDSGISRDASLLLSCQGLSDSLQDDQAVCAAQLNWPLLH